MLLLPSLSTFCRARIIGHALLVTAFQGDDTQSGDSRWHFAFSLNVPSLSRRLHWQTTWRCNANRPAAPRASGTGINYGSIASMVDSSGARCLAIKAPAQRCNCQQSATRIASAHLQRTEAANQRRFSRPKRQRGVTTSTARRGIAVLLASPVHELAAVDFNGILLPPSCTCQGPRGLRGGGREGGRQGGTVG